MNRKVVIDIDGTLCPVKEEGQEYSELPAYGPVVSKLRDLRSQGYYIVLYTSRNMRTYGGNVGLITVHTVPSLLEWLDSHGVPYDELIVGKPWCGPKGYYVDDRAIRPSEFVRMDDKAIEALLLREKAFLGEV